MVDATLGLGGHTEAVLTRCELARVIGIDRDPAALELARTRLAPYGDRFTGVHAVYDELPEVLDDLGLDAVDAVLFDLGVSSMQLDVRERGFAYAEDAPLDMRMDGTTGPDRRRRPQHLLGRRADPRAPRVRRGEVRPQDRRRPSSASASRRRSPPRPAWSSCCTPRSRRRPAAPAATRPSAPSRRCAWRSTTSSPSCAGRSPPPSTRSRSAAGSSWSPTTRSRTGWSSRPSPRSPAPRSPRTCRSSPRAARRRSAWSPAAPSRPTPPRSPPTRAPPRSGSAPSNASGHHFPGGSSMSTRPSASRRRSSRARAPVEAAVDRARLTVVPHRRRVRAPRMPFVTLVSVVLLGGIVGLLCFNTQMQQASFAATHPRGAGREPHRPRADPARRAPGPARPPAPRGARRPGRHGRAAERLHAAAGGADGHGHLHRRDAGQHPQPVRAGAGASRAVLDPAPIVVTVQRRRTSVPARQAGTDQQARDTGRG